MADKIKLEGILSKGYGFAPKIVLRDTRLSIEAKAIYSYFASYAGNGESAFPSVELVCNDLGISEKRFRKHRKLLEECGYIEVLQVREGKGFKHNIYTLKQLVPETNVSGHFIPTQNVSLQNVSLQNDRTNSNSLKSNNINNNSNKNKPSQSDKLDFENMFKEIWAIYPNKKGMQSAKRKFMKIVKSLKDAEIIKEGVINYANYCKVKQVQPEFIRHGSTFFNNESWLDDWKTDLPQNIPKRNEPDYSLPQEFDNPKMSDLNERDFPF